MATASAVAVVVLIAFGVAALANRGSHAPEETESSRLASRAAVSAPQEASPPPAAPPVAALLEPTLPSPMLPEPTLPSPTAPTAAQPSTASQPGAAGSTTPGTPEAGAGTATAEGHVVEESPTSPPPAEPVQCTNDVLDVRAEVVGTEHRVGERTLLRLVVANSSDQPCVRDLDPARQEIVVWSADGSVRLWSSDDCSSAKGTDLRTLRPGEPVAFTVRWVGRTSAPGCPVERETVPAGEYRLLSRVDDVISPPTQFVRIP